MHIEPRNHALTEVCLVGVAPVQGRMLFPLVFCIFDFLAETAQRNEYFIPEKRGYVQIQPSVHDEERCFDSIKIEKRRVLDVPVAELPGRSAHQSLAMLCDRGPEYGSVV